MSGPKCDSYYVEDDRNELLRQAQRAEAERAARVARERLDAPLRWSECQQKLAAIVATGKNAEQQFGATIDSIRRGLPSFPGQNSSVQEIERYVTAVQATAAHITAEIGKAEGLAQLRSLVAASSQVAQVADWNTTFRNVSRQVAPKPSPTKLITAKVAGRSRSGLLAV